KLEAVYNTADESPESLADLDGRLVLPADSALTYRLAYFYPQLDFKTVNNTNSESLMAHVAAGRSYSTIAAADLVAINQQYHTQLRAAFELRKINRRLAWAFPEKKDNLLYNKAI